MNKLGSWVLTPEPGMNPQFFTGYRNSQSSLIVGVVLNLQSKIPLDGKKCYFCIVCKTDNRDAIRQIFARIQPPPPVKDQPLRVEDETGFIAWMKREELKATVESLLNIVCSEETLGHGKVPLSVAADFQAKIDAFLSPPPKPNDNEQNSDTEQ